MNIRSSVIIASIIACLCATAGAQTTIINYTKASTGTNYNARTVTSSSSTQYTWDFSDTVVFMEDTSGTLGNSNVKFYGGAILSAAAFSSAPVLRLTSAAPGNIQAQLSTAASTATRNATAMYVWKKEDFLNNGNNDTVSFSSGASMSFTFPAAVGTTSRDIKFVVLQNGNYYVSQSSFATASNGAATYSFDPTTSDWGIINTSNYSVGGYSSLVMSNVQAVGLFLSASSTISTTQINLTISDFQVAGTLTAIPEPSTYAALAGLGALGFVAWRRCRTAQVAAQG